MSALSLSVKAKLFLFFLWMLALVVINPFGEYPINDDWAYARNVYDLVVNGKFIVDPWPAMNLVSQTIYGSIFAGLFGFSFTVLRMSIFVLAIISSFVLYDLAFKLSAGKHWIAFYVAVSFCFSTLFCALSFTFMTDIFFLSFTIMAFNELYKYIHSKRNVNYVFFILFSVVAVLNRQQGLVIPLLIIIPVLYNQKLSFGNIVKALLPFFLCWLAQDKYVHYLNANGIGHNIQKIDDLRNYLRSAPFGSHWLNGGDALLVIGWMLAPLNVLLLNQFKSFRWKDLAIYLLSVLATVFLVYTAITYYPTGNISRILEVGPRIIKGSPFPLLSPSWFQAIKISVAAISFISICNSIFFLIRDKKDVQARGWGKYFHLPLLLVIIVYFVFVAISKAYFDRYALPLAFFFAIWLVPQINIGKMRFKPVLIAILVLVYAFTLLEIRDFHNWQKERWAVLAYLNKKGISAHEIDGGFEYNGWLKPNRDFSGGDKSWWWVDKDTYLLSHGEMQNFETDSLFVFQRCLPYQQDTIFLLKKIENQ